MTTETDKDLAVDSDSDIDIREVSYEHTDSSLLLSAQLAEIAVAYGRTDSERGEPTTAANVALFVVAYADGMPAGCGGLRQLSDSEFEIKRMYVTPAHRGTGVSIAVLNALETACDERGGTRVLLETGERLPAARRFYEREGYSRIENFGAYADEDGSICYAKSLAE